MMLWKRLNNNNNNNNNDDDDGDDDEVWVTQNDWLSFNKDSLQAIM